MSDHNEYLKKFAISQSSLKDWKNYSPLKWYKMWVTKEMKRPMKVATKFGSFLDCIMFTPNEAEKRFIITDVKPPSDKVKLILHDAYDTVEELNRNAEELNKDKKGVKIPIKEHTLEDKELICSLCAKHDHYKSKPDQGYNDVIKKGEEYFEFLKKAKGKEIITADENITALRLKEALLTDPVSKGFFIPKTGCEVLFQVRIFTEFELSGFENVEFLPMKGAIDIIHINHKRKEVREVDLKWTTDVYTFYERIKQFDYPGQHSVYDYLIRQWLKTYLKGKYKDYQVMNPLNVVIDDDAIPYLYSYNSDDLAIKRYGIEGTPIKGWEDTINDIAWHFDNENWSRPREHQMNGFLSVKTFNRR